MKLSRSLLLHIFFLVSFLLVAVNSVHANQIKGARAWPSPDNTRVVLDLSGQPDYEISYLKKPDRLVVDIKSTQSTFNLKSMRHKGPLVKNIRESASNSKTTYRLVVDLKKASKAKVFTLPPAKPYGHRLVIDLPHQAPVVAEKMASSENIVQAPNAGRDVIIAVDAGHGGDDPGALGQFSYEKKVTLEIAKKLQARINHQTGMRAFLIRDGDYYINLNKRSELAVKGKADFLVSIHADGFTSSKPSGASVWILSDRRANSEMGRRIERHEVHSELLGGKGEIAESASSVPFLNKVFFDMSKSNSMQVGSDVAHLVVNEFKTFTKLHKKVPVGASLAVLKSPYIPSILVEAGFITNHREERLLNQAEYQSKVANAVYKGIFKHFTESPPHDSLFAQKKRAIKHTVRSGESLSILAGRYSVSASELKSYNQLKSSALRIGQVLRIPPNYELVVKADPVSTQPNIVAPTVYQSHTHSVKRGESLSVIASRYGLSTTELKNYNQLRSTSLAVGQEIKIPGNKVTPAQPTVHIVKRGESLSVIAARYGQSSDALKRHNNLRSTALAVGQKIKIPTSGAKVAAISTKTISAKKIPAKKIAKPTVHKVSRGESLSVIAKRYGKTTNELKAFNHLRSTSLAVGQKINIPQSGTQVSNPVVKKVLKPTVHKVRSGESLSVIAKRYGKTTKELTVYNQLRSTTLAVGQKINIPHANSTQGTSTAKARKLSQPSLHTVRRGESLSVIADRYGKTTQALKTYNKLSSTSLRVGQKLKIPGDKSVISPAVSKKAAVHTVRSGESLSVIAARYATSSSLLKHHNKLRSTTLSVGQKINIPANADKLTTHKVRSGESLSVIAKRYGTSTSIIKSMNKLRSNSLAIGQLLTIPTT